MELKQISAHRKHLIGLGALTVAAVVLSAMFVARTPGTDGANKANLDALVHPMVAAALHDSGLSASKLSISCVDAQSTSGSPTDVLDFADLADAYDLNTLYKSGDDGGGSTIAIVEFAPFLPRDLATFKRCIGARSNVRTVLVDGGPGTARRAGKSLEGQLEADMDVEETVGLAPGAHVIVFEGTDATTAGILDTYAAAVDSGANVITTSWGTCESAVSATLRNGEAVVFQHAAQLGETVVAASGDEGSEDCYDGAAGSNGLAVDDPASQPEVTGVGGTTLTKVGHSFAETVWNEGTSVGAGGGGYSADWAMPAYQDTASLSQSDSVDATCTASTQSCRMVPDVVADAGTPVIFYCSERPVCDGWNGYGGTSVAAPLWAAIFALADANTACAGSPVGFANPALYAIAAGTGASSAFTGIDTGNNDLQHDTGNYGATAGYNLASGLGSPLVGNGHDGRLIAQLCASARTATYAVNPTT